MSSGGQTTVVKRILEQRAERPPASHEETTATLAVMLRVVPPPKALIACTDPAIRERLERHIDADLLDVVAAVDETEGLRRFGAEACAVVVTDSLELVRRIRAQSADRPPLVLFVSDLDESSERETGLIAGADLSVGRRSSDRELAACLGVAKRVAELEHVLRVTLAENRKLSTTDDLTRVASRRFFSKHFPREMERASRYSRPLSLILCDIDRFKGINDSLGHSAGDQILQQFGSRLQHALRRGIDWVARIGGEEFAIVLPETGYEQALGVARKLRSAIAQTRFACEGRTIPVTASFGLCGLDKVPAGERQLAQRVLKIADAALYRSKNSGRNRVTATMFGSASG